MKLKLTLQSPSCHMQQKNNLPHPSDNCSAKIQTLTQYYRLERKILY